MVARRRGRGRQRRGPPSRPPGPGERQSLTPLAERLALPPALRDQIVAHAKADAPKEACGLIAGRGAQAARVIRCANVHPAPVSRFALDRREQIRAFIDMEANGEELVAIYHSHPVTQPYPSPIDQKEWHYPDALLLVLSLRDATPELCAFRVRDGWVREVELT